LPQSPIAASGYADRFRCIGSACEDTCCSAFTVPIDRTTFEKYRALAPSPLRALLDANILLTEDAGIQGIKPSPSVFAVIRMTPANQCPMLSPDKLCRIQTEQGHEFLSHICATYPRIVYNFDGMEEKALTLSCPEAARLVLLTPDLFNSFKPPSTREDSGPPIQGVQDGRNSLLSAWLRPIRHAVLSLVRNRTYPLWQRIFLLGVLCRRLDSIAQGEIARGVPAFLADFEATVAAGALLPAMATLPYDGPAQMDAVLRLAGMMLRRSNITPRFVECIEAFKTGIGNGPGATLESLTSNYAFAHDRFYAPFFDRHPYILENLLINTILRCQFPFGRPPAHMQADPADAEPPTTMTREFALLTAQFALVKGLLIGVAGCHREGFSAAHVVHTVQAASKHFEHHPEFLKMAHALLVECQLDGARGLAVLLRNAAQHAPIPPFQEKRVPVPQAGTPV
jgi:lysine-N-methylase